MPVTGNVCPTCEQDDTVGHKMTFYGTATAEQLATLGMRGVVLPIATGIDELVNNDGYNPGTYVRYAPVIQGDGSVRIEALFTPSEQLCDAVRVEPIGPVIIGS